QMALEIFDNVTTIQQIGVESHFQEKYDEMLRKREGPLKRKIRYQAVVQATNQSLFFFVDFITTVVGVYFVYLGYFTPQVLFLAQ
ncbi:hypothetical protein PENTCL1PPCAC_5923, partial [Pristionchus entomophagus]